MAISALGTGIDIGGIVAVVHMEQPWGLVDFVQQTGRGARREGELVDSVIVMSEGRAWRDGTRGDVEQANTDVMERFVGSLGCRREVLSEFMDGKRLSCRDVSGEACDRCRGDNEQEGEEEEEEEK